MSDARCPICDSQAEIIPSNRDEKSINCSKCGKYFANSSLKCNTYKN